MEDQLLTGVRAKETTPVMSALGQHSIVDDDDDDALKHVSVLLSQPPQQRGFLRSIVQTFRNYLTALLITLPMVPIFVSVVTVGIYLSNPSAPGWYSVLFGMLYANISWWVITLILVPLTSARNSNAHSYGLLYSRFRQLEARLHVINDYHHANPQQPLGEYQEVAMQEALDKFDDLNSDLHDNTVRLPWLMGFGYVNAWTKLHRAEEALVEVEPLEIAMRGAMHDKMAIAGSQLSNRDELLDKIIYAVKKLDPQMVNLFKLFVVPVAPSENENADVQQLHHDPEDPARAQLTLREVRRSLNEYRDHLWEGLVRARNNLLWVTFVTGLGTHTLLCITILAMSSANGASRTTIITAATYYVVGAIAGLIVTINNEPVVSTAIDDYNFSFIRLLANFILSGLTALGGVMIIGLLYELLFSGHATYSLQDIFQLDVKPYLLVAVIFGFTSNLIIRRVRKNTKNYVSALLSSSSSTREYDEGETRLPLSSKSQDEGETRLPLSSKSQDEGESRLLLSSKSQLEQIYKYEIYQERRWFSTAIGAATTGFIIILSGVAILLTKGILIGVVVMLLGGVPEIGAFLALQQSKKASERLNQRSLKMRDRTSTESEPLSPPL